jgi:hypothetical protein
MLEKERCSRPSGAKSLNSKGQPCTEGTLYSKYVSVLHPTLLFHILIVHSVYSFFTFLCPSLNTNCPGGGGVTHEVSGT